MTDKQLNVPTESIEYLLNVIETRIQEIGETYISRGQGAQDDLEISALRALARQLGCDFALATVSSGFSVKRHNYTPVG